MKTRNSKSASIPNLRKRKPVPPAASLKRRKKNTSVEQASNSLKKRQPKKKVSFIAPKNGTDRNDNRKVLMASAEEVAEMFQHDSQLIGVRDITDKFLETYTGTTAVYDKAKDSTLAGFFDLLKANEKMRFLAQKNDKQLEHFFVLNRHCKDANTKFIINKALCLWANHVKLHRYKGIDVESLSEKDFAKIQCEPNTILTKEKMLWAAFRLNVSKLPL